MIQGKETSIYDKFWKDIFPDICCRGTQKSAGIPRYKNDNTMVEPIDYEIVSTYLEVCHQDPEMTIF